MIKLYSKINCGLGPAIMKFRMRRRDRYECDVPHHTKLTCIFTGKYR